jgi:hypothetical protein
MVIARTRAIVTPITACTYVEVIVDFRRGAARVRYFATCSLALAGSGAGVKLTCNANAANANTASAQINVRLFVIKVFMRALLTLATRLGVTKVVRMPL